MKKLLAAGLLALTMSPLTAMADITVNIPKGVNLDSLTYDYTTIQNLATAKSRAERGTVVTKAPVKDGKVILPIASDKSGYNYNLHLGERSYASLYALPGENIIVDITSTDPLDYKLSGSPLIDQINEVKAIEKPFIDRMNELSKAATPDREKMQAVYGDYIEAIKDFVEENPTSPTAVVALMNISGDDFVNAYNHLGERAKTSPLFPLLQRQFNREQERLEKDRKLAELSSGNVVAPDFTLEDQNGKKVSLSDFKGKWVIIDFWGTWCPWCIKGFPELKEAYTNYKGELEIIGVDCGDSVEAWKNGLVKYELPWVNVYNPETSTLLEQYAVQGFPTKAIINPEGKIANMTVGHDPAFFEKLKELMGK